MSALRPSGMKNTSPSGTHTGGVKPPGSSTVNDSPTRSGVAPSPGTLGGRVA